MVGGSERLGASQAQPGGRAFQAWRHEWPGPYIPDGIMGPLTGNALGPLATSNAYPEVIVRSTEHP